MSIKYLPPSIIKLEHWQNHETNRGGYLKGLAYDIFHNPLQDRSKFYLARELLYTKRYESAIKLFKEHIKMNKWDIECSQSYIYIGDCMKALKEEKKAVEYWLKSLSVFSRRREAYLRLAEHYLNKKQYEDCIGWCKHAMTIPPCNYYAENAEHYGKVPHEYLYRAYGWIGQIDKAREHILKALEFDPENPIYLRDLQYYFEFPPVSIIIPNYKRDVSKLVESLNNDLYHGEKEIIIQKDTDGNGVAKTFNEGVEKAEHELTVFLGDDAIVTQHWLNQAYIEYLKQFKHGTGLIALNDGILYPDGGNDCTHFLIHKDLRNLLEDGQIFHEDFHHVGCDNWLSAQCKKQGKYHYAKYAKIIHNHFSNGFEMDETHKKGWSHVEEDRQTLKNKMIRL